MQKTIIILLAVLLALSALTACGSSPLESTPLESAPLESAPLESTPKQCLHEYTGETTKEATVFEEGVMTYTCVKCGDTYTEAIEKRPCDWNFSTSDVVDDFGDPTGEKLTIIWGTFSGSFSDSSTSGADLTAQVFIIPSAYTNTKSVAFMLDEYGTDTVMPKETDDWTLKVKTDNGQIRSFDMYDGLAVFDDNLLKLIMNSSNLKFAITRSSKYSNDRSKYLFETNNFGLAEIIESSE